MGWYKLSMGPKLIAPMRIFQIIYNQVIGFYKIYTFIYVRNVVISGKFMGFPVQISILCYISRFLYETESV